MLACGRADAGREFLSNGMPRLADALAAALHVEQAEWCARFFNVAQLGAEVGFLLRFAQGQRLRDEVTGKGASC
ncbi:hypothetical protein LP419_12760 [Massilia sp. H-1]|nr:hypothetical protein LP419_12760 [Massilia sp. H-1]